MTTIYLIRHSKTLKVNNEFNNDNLQIQNEKYSLSIEGEQIAQDKLNKDDLNNIDTIYSSNYVRAIQTAKYIAEKNNLEINIDSDLGERKFGINNWNELPENFERNQLLDENYKIGNGESRKEVTNRMYNSILRILNDNKNKRIAIISHGTAITFLLNKWCNIEYINDKLRYSFEKNLLLEGYIDNCDCFKLEFDDNNNLVNIENKFNNKEKENINDK